MTSQYRLDERDLRSIMVTKVATTDGYELDVNIYAKNR